MSDTETLRVYSEKAREYADITDSANKRDPLLEAFIAALPVGGTVLDLGCGPGASAAQMAKSGLQVHAFDPVAEMIAIARQHKGVMARQASFEDISGDDIYDGVWANFSLLHAKREDVPRYLENIIKTLKPGGRLHVAVKSGIGSKRDRIGRLYTYFTDAELTEMLNTAGFTVTDRASGRGKGLDGSEADWISLAAHA